MPPQRAAVCLWRLSPKMQIQDSRGPPELALIRAARLARSAADGSLPLAWLAGRPAAERPVGRRCRCDDSIDLRCKGSERARETLAKLETGAPVFVWPCLVWPRAAKWRAGRNPASLCTIPGAPLRGARSAKPNSCRPRRVVAIVPVRLRALVRPLARWLAGWLAGWHF